MRLNKYISESGICSRREADRIIERGGVTINGRRGVVGDQVEPGDRVVVDGREIEARVADEVVIIALNKPVGVVSTTDPAERDNIVRFVGHPKRLFPIGRLDKDSQGLILLTNDGDIVNRILRAGNEHQKEYLVTVRERITPEFVQGMAGGVPILGQTTKRCEVSRVDDHTFRIVLVQGLNRQIRRMCAHFGYHVIRLERVRIMHIRLDGLRTGDWRDLGRDERAELDRLIAHSSGEAPPGHRKPQPGKPQPGKPEPGKPEHGKPEHGKQTSRGPQPRKPEPSKTGRRKPETRKPGSGAGTNRKQTGGDSRAGAKGRPGAAPPADSRRPRKRR